MTVATILAFFAAAAVVASQRITILAPVPGQAVSASEPFVVDLREGVSHHASCVAVTLR